MSTSIPCSDVQVKRQTFTSSNMWCNCEDSLEPPSEMKNPILVSAQIICNGEISTVWSVWKEEKDEIPFNWDAVNFGNLM